MRTIHACLAAGLLQVASLSSVAETATARLFCLSLRFQQGESDAGNFTLDLSTIEPPSPPNGELAPTFDAPSHFSGFILEDQDLLISIPGVISVDVPLEEDANQNGFADFFEVSRAVSSSTSGNFATQLDTGTVAATWSRAAGSKDGNCVFQLTATNGSLRPLGNFAHLFELIEYEGPLTYTPGSNQVSAAIALTQTGSPARRVAGPLEFRKVPSDRFNTLELRTGTWTNDAGQSMVFTNETFLRDELLKTNYYGFVDFFDGEPATPGVDYLTWALSIDDPNDADNDGIPNLSDDPGSTPIPPPRLSLSRGGAGLLLSISGTVGRSHEIQEVPSLTLTNWNTVLSVTLTNDPQVVPLPLASDAARFWRVRVP